MKIAFLGIGIMGNEMATRLLGAGHELRVYNRSDNEALQALVQKGAQRCDSPAIAVSGCEIIITMLSHPDAVNAVVRGDHGLLQGAARNSLWMDCSTVDPEFSRGMAAEAKKAGLEFLDSPVAGSKIPARNGELVFLVGGDESSFLRAQPVMEILGRKSLHCGDSGQGSAMKLVVNFMLAQTVLAASEAVAIGKNLGLAESHLLDTLLATPVAAPILTALRPRFEGKDTEVHFPLKHMLKDLKLAKASLPAGRTDLSLLAAGIDYYENALSTADQDFSEIYQKLTENG